MSKFVEFVKRRILDEAGEVPGQEDLQAIQQQPEPAPQGPSMLAGAAEGAGAGLIVGLLGVMARKKLKQMAAARGYLGPAGILNFAKSLLGIKTGEQPYQYTPEEQRKLAARLEQMILPPGYGASDPNGQNKLLDERLQDFTTKLFNPAKTPKNAVAALHRAVTAFTNKQPPDAKDQEMVSAALTRGAASDAFKQWYKLNSRKEVEQSKKLRKGKDGQYPMGVDGKPPMDDDGRPMKTAQWTSYEAGKMPMNKVDFNTVIRFYYSQYGYAEAPYVPGYVAPPKGPKPAPAVHTPSPIEKDAAAHGLNRTAMAIRNITSPHESVISFKDFMNG